MVEREEEKRMGPGGVGVGGTLRMGEVKRRWVKWGGVKREWMKR